MKKSAILFLTIFCSCSFSISYESLYQIKTASSSPQRCEAVLTDGSKKSVASQASGTYTIYSQSIAGGESVSSSLDDEAFRKLCPTPSALIKEINIYSVNVSSESSTENLTKTIPVADKEWSYRRLAQNMGAYIYELK